MFASDFPTNPKVDALVARFPRLFKGQHPRVWSDLPQGWTELTGRLFADLDQMLDDDAAKRFENVQIKEKFAGLRVCWRLGEEETFVLDILGSGSTQRLALRRPRLGSRLFDRAQP